MALARLRPLLLHFGVQIVELELTHNLMRQLFELFFVFRVKYVLTTGSVQNFKQPPDRVRDAFLKGIPRLVDLRGLGLICHEMRLAAILLWYSSLVSRNGVTKWRMRYNRIDQLI